MKTVSQLAKELGVSKSTLHRTIQRNDFKTIQQGNKWLIDETIEKAIIQALQEKTFQGDSIQNDSETLQKRVKNDSRNDTDSILIEELRAQIAELKADKSFFMTQLKEKDSIISALTAEREQERKERQTILAELLHLRGQKRIEIKAAPSRSEQPRPKGAATSSTQDKPKQKLSFIDKLKAAADIFKR